jgi:DNA-binding transcriptional ArsR family regulator
MEDAVADRTERELRRTVEEAVSYGVGSRVRIEILCILNEGTHSASELARMIRLPLTTISHHIREMANSGCIEVARVEKVRNADQHFYRAVKLPFVSDLEAAEMSPEAFQEHAALILQAIMAEGLGALWAGKMSHDPTLRLMWRWFNLDEEGRQELADEQRESWERIVEIEARATNRRTESGETPITMVAATMGFLRSRPVGGSVAAMGHLAPREN